MVGLLGERIMVYGYVFYGYDVMAHGAFHINGMPRKYVKVPKYVGKVL